MGCLMKKSAFKFILLLIAGLFLINLNGQIYAQNDKSLNIDIPEDTTFNEIILTGDGVSAVDTFGYEWYYDFEQDVFVQGLDGDEATTDLLDDGGSTEFDIIPVEERCTELRKVKAFVNSVTIGEDEYVDGNIIAYGRVTVKGWVKGDVKSLNKRVLVSSTGQVDGNIEAPDIIVKEGGIVIGNQIISDAPLEFKDITSFSIDGVIIVLSFTVFFVFIGFMVTSLMPRKFKVFDECLCNNKVKSYAIGFFFLLMMPFIVLLVTITIVGIVLVPLIPFVYLLAVIMGVVSLGNKIGSTIFMRSEGTQRSAIFQSMIGILVFMAFWLLTAILLSMNNSVSEGFGVFTLIIAIIVSTFPLLSGIGAAFLTRFGFRPYVSWQNRQYPRDTKPAPAPAPPPLPDTPPIPFSSDSIQPTENRTIKRPPLSNPPQQKPPNNL